MRQYIRHPADIPIQVEGPHYSCRYDTPSLRNASVSLRFNSRVPLEADSIIKVRINVAQIACEVCARVNWSRLQGGHYEAEVVFAGTEDAFRIRMVEQVCYIEHYRKAISILEGRKLSYRQAAQEWIKRFAHQFPAFTT